MTVLTEEYMERARREDRSEQARIRAEDKAALKAKEDAAQIKKDNDAYRTTVDKFDAGLQSNSATALGAVWNLAVKTSSGDKRSRPTVGQSVAALGKSMFLLGKTAIEYGEFLEENKETGARVAQEDELKKAKGKTAKSGNPVTSPGLEADSDDIPSTGTVVGGGSGHTGRRNFAGLGNDSMASGPSV